MLLCNKWTDKIMDKEKFKTTYQNGQYYIVKCDGKGNISLFPDAHKKELITAEYNKGYNETLSLDEFKTFKEAQQFDIAKIYAARDSAVDKIKVLIDENNTEKKTVLLIWGGDNYQENSPFTYIIALLQKTIPNIKLFIFKKIKIEEQDKNAKIIKTWNTWITVVPKESVYGVRTSKDPVSITNQCANLIWYYGVTTTRAK